MNKKNIICLVGKSGSGKSMIATYIERMHHIPSIESYTTRPKRYEGEKGHTFISELEFSTIKKEDMIAFTKFGEYNYCTIKQDVEENNVYILDEIGLKYLKENFSKEYNIYAIWIDRKDNLRNVSKERKERDEGMFLQENKSLYDSFLFNNGGVEESLLQLDMILQGAGFIKKTPSPMDYIYYVEKQK